MSEDTQNRLKAFLNRNKNRIAGSGTENEETKTALAGSLRTRNDNQRFESPPKYQHPSNYPASPEPLNSDTRVLTLSTDRNDRNNDVGNSTIDFRPVSLFDVIGNASYGGQGSTTNNSVMNHDGSKMHFSVAHSVANSSPERRPDSEFNSINERRIINDTGLDKEFTSARAHENGASPVRFKSNTEKETLIVNSHDEGHQTKTVEKRERKDSGFSSTNEMSYKPRKDLEPVSPLRVNKDTKKSTQEKKPVNNQTVEKQISGQQNKITIAENSSKQSSLMSVPEPGSRSPYKTKSEASEAKNIEVITEKSTELFSESSRTLNALNDSAPNDAEFK